MLTPDSWCVDTNVVTVVVLVRVIKGKQAPAELLRSTLGEG
jgi:hypothetical protein